MRAITRYRSREAVTRGRRRARTRERRVGAPARRVGGRGAGVATFVVVHGGWSGAWEWRAFAPLLQEAGHEVLRTTLTGLGERSHLASPTISLGTHIQDVVNVLFYEDLRDVLLVGHSYGGIVVTGVAERVPER